MHVTKPVVFISSPTKDLQEHRAAAAKAARQGGFDVQMMEDFEAQSLKPPYPGCMEKVPGCDVPVVIVAHRYGWVPPDQPGKPAKSITWLECEEVRTAGKEVLAFVMHEQHKWPAELKGEYRATEASLAGKQARKKQSENLIMSDSFVNPPSGSSTPEALPCGSVLLVL